MKRRGHLGSRSGNCAVGYSMNLVLPAEINDDNIVLSVLGMRIGKDCLKTNNLTGDHADDRKAACSMTEICNLIRHRPGQVEVEVRSGVQVGNAHGFVT